MDIMDSFGTGLILVLAILAVIALRRGGGRISC